MAEFNVKFVGQKLSKIRWRPTQSQSIIQSDVFATGSWDDEDNKIRLWSLEQLSRDDREGPGSVLDSEPHELCSVTQRGDVTDLSFITNDHIAAASSTGNVAIYRHHLNSQTLSVAHCWDDVHYLAAGSCSCTCLTTKGDDVVVSGGEDGRIVVLNVNRRQPERVIESADSCTINAITFLKQTEVITVNSFGQLKIFDFRQNTAVPTRTYTVTEEHSSLQCVAKHPGQAHIVATGGQDGMLTIWDLRQDKFPMTLLEAHSATMWEVKFHPHNPDHLFTCSDDGSVWHWDGTSVRGSASTSSFVSGLRGDSASSTGHISSWLNLDSARQKLEITSLLPTRSLPVNSLDIDRDTLLCGTDSETLYTISLPGLV
ncbi:nucleoporin Nup43-like [Haliotis cracherodii]|uniref:nucleoporin Nup43-like n=1 Tax=Haliotis cracherodii TaxID=6455 RepID=UPI0039ED3C50